MVARLVLLVLVGLYAGCTANATATTSPPTAAAVAEVAFSPAEIRIIRDYYDSAGRGPGVGKGGKQGLPPGIAKNLARGKPLPPGIAKNYLPRDLVLQLPPVPDGYERIVVAGKILLVEIATQVVRDILTDVLFD